MYSDRFKETLHVDHAGDRDHPLFLHENIRCCPAVLVGGKSYLRPARIGLHEIREWKDARDRVEVVLSENPVHLALDPGEDIGNGDPGFLEVFIAGSAGKCDRLEVHPSHESDILNGKPDDIPQLMIIPSPDNRRHKHSSEPGLS